MGNYLCPCLKEYNGCCGDMSINRSGIRINVIEATTTVPIRTPTESLSLEGGNADIIIKSHAASTIENLRRSLSQQNGGAMKNNNPFVKTPSDNSINAADVKLTAPNQSAAMIKAQAPKTVTGIATVTFGAPLQPVSAKQPSSQMMINQLIQPSLTISSGNGKLFYQKGLPHRVAPLL